MRRFVSKLIIYVGITLLIFTIADFFLSRKLRRSNILEFQAWNNIYKHKWNSDVVIMGSSRAFVHFNPLIIDSILHVNSYNLGYNGSLVNRQVERYYAYCRIQNHVPKFIIYSLDYGTISGISINFEREQFYPYFFYDRNLMNAFDKYQKFSIMEKYIPFWRYCSCFLDFHVYDVLTNPEEREIFYKGFKNERREASVRDKIDSLSYSFTPEALLIFKDFIRDVINNGSKCIFVYSPLYSGLVINGVCEIFAEYDKIANEYNIPVLDYTHDSICSDSSLFYNSTHLNKKGADIFSLMVSKDIDRLKLIK